MGWRQFTPLYFYTAVALCLGFLGVSEYLAAWKIFLLLVCGVLSWALIEYGLHRFIFHYQAQSRLGRQLLYLSHLSHHESPEALNRLFASLLLSAPLAAVYLLLAWVVTGSLAEASYLFIGMSSGYFYYEWVHFQCHHRKSRLWLFKYLRKYHLLHHYKSPGLRFGVTSPLFDLMFGTFRPVVKRRRVNQYLTESGLARMPQPPSRPQRIK